MRFSRFFIDRPIFAAVVSIVIFIAGCIAMVGLPVSEYPEVVPPSVVVRAIYPGANPRVISEAVATPLEEQVNGVENMLYMNSQATSDGVLTLTVTFRVGTDPDLAQVQVQNRVSQALPRLPEEVRQLGVTTVKSSPNFIMVVHLISPEKRYDVTYLRNYGLLQVKDVLARIPGIGQVAVFGGGGYSMRVWLDPGKIAARGLAATDVVNAIREQNVQVAAGVVGGPPMPVPVDYQLSINARGRLANEEEFGNIILKTGQNGELTRLRDVARIELSAGDYALRSLLNGKEAVGIGIFQAPGSNALELSSTVRKTMEELRANFPQGVDYRIVYDPTVNVRDGIREVVKTLFEAILLVVLVVVLFLQTWRASVIPLVAVPISIVGTFAILLMFGFSINTLSLFGLVLAIGIVVDDAIVVVENVERNIESGLSPRDAAYKSMDEVGGALVAIALVLCAVFVPSAFITGISGQFYRQFALTIASATIISLIVSLTLSPAMCALLLKRRPERHEEKWWERPIRGFFRGFNWGFDRVGAGYHWLIARAVRYVVIMLVLYVGILAYGLNEFRKTPIGFIPQVDRGYLIVVLQLPAGSSLSRTDEIQQRVVDVALKTPGVAHAVNIVGFNGATFTQAPNSGAVFLTLEPWDKRGRDPKESA